MQVFLGISRGKSAHASRHLSVCPWKRNVASSRNTSWPWMSVAFLSSASHPIGARETSATAQQRTARGRELNIGPAAGKVHRESQAVGRD